MKTDLHFPSIFPNGFYFYSNLIDWVCCHTLELPTDQESPDTTEPATIIETHPQVQGPCIELPRIDDQFDKFFSTVENIKDSKSVEIEDVDLDSAVKRSSEL